MNEPIFANRLFVVVDDETFSRKMVAQMLAGLGKPSVLEAEDGAEALEALARTEQKVDCVIADFRMPKMNGLELLKAIRVGTNRVRRDLPFAMLTGHSDSELVQFAIALDVDAFLVKPVSKNGLATRIGGVLRSEKMVSRPELYRNVPVKTLDGDPMAESPEVDERIRDRGIRIDPNTMRGPVASADVIEEKPSYRCHIEKIPANAILGKPVTTSQGKVLLRAGVPLSPMILARLKDLVPLEPEVEYLWVEMQ